MSVTDLRDLWRPAVGFVCGCALAAAVFVEKVSEAKLFVLAGFVGALAGLRTLDKGKAR